MKSNNIVAALIAASIGFAPITQAFADPALDKIEAQANADIALDQKKIHDIQAFLAQVNVDPGLETAGQAAVAAGILGVTPTAVTVLSILKANGLIYMISGFKKVPGTTDFFQDGHPFMLDDFMKQEFKVGKFRWNGKSTGISGEAVRTSIRLGGWLVLPCVLVSTGNLLYVAILESDVQFQNLRIGRLNTDIRVKQLALQHLKELK